MTAKLPDIYSFRTSSTPGDFKTGLLAYEQEKSSRSLRAKHGRAPLPEPGTQLQVHAFLTNELRTKIQDAPHPVTISEESPRNSDVAVVIALAQKNADSDISHLEPFCEWVKTQAQDEARLSPGLHLVGVHPLIQKGRELIGKLAFVLDQQNAKEILTTFNEKITPEAKRDYINEMFSTHVKALKRSHELLVRTETNIGLANSATLSHANLARSIATALITSNGCLNLAVSDAVVSELACDNNHIKETIDRYKATPELRQILAQVVAPSSKESSAWTLIATICALPASAELDATSAKRALLATQLTTLPQQNEQCGYASSIGRMLTQLRPDLYANDLKAILTDSSLHRTIGNETVDIPVVVSNLADQSVDALSLAANKNGTIKGQNLWDVYAVKLAAQVMGISDVKQAVLDALSRILTKNTAIISPRSLIVELAAGDQDKTDRGIAAYCSTNANPLSRSWQLCMQSLAETRPSDAMQARVLRAIQGALFGLFTVKKLDNDANRFNPQAVATFIQSLLTRIHSQIEVTYDDASHSFTVNDIDTPEKFNQFVLSNLTSEVLASLPDLQRNALVNTVQEFVGSGKFLQAALVHFDPINASVTNAAEKWKTLRFTPWKAPLGNNPVDFVHTYLEETPETIGRVQASTAKDLLSQLLSFAKGQKDAKQQQIQVALPSNVFTLDTTGKFAEAIANRISASAWTRDYASKASAIKTSDPLSQDEREKIAKWVEKRLIPDAVSEQFQQALANIEADCTLESYCNEMLALVKLYQQINEATLPENYMETAKQMLTSFVIRKALPQKAQEKMAELTLPIADVSIAAKDKAHLCIYPNPFTGEPSLGLYAANTVRPLNEESWIANQTWELSVTKI